MPSAAPGLLTLHATSVAQAGRAVLIRGPSGSGKSSLALQLMAMGGALVSDDRTIAWRDGDHLMLGAPPAIRGQIEARGVGILNAPAETAVHAALIVDLTDDPVPRLPPHETETILGVSLPLVRGNAAGHFPAAIHVYLLHGRRA